MKKSKNKVAVMMAIAMASSVFAGCGDTNAESEQAGTTSSDSAENSAESGESAGAQEYSDLTEEEKEALEAGLINLDGTLPIVTDPKAFEEKYGNITMHFVTNANRVVDVSELDMVKKYEEDTGVVFDWITIPAEGAAEKINLLLSGGEDLPDVFWNFGSQSGTTVVQYADQELFYPTEELIENYMPSLKKILDDNEEYKKQIIAPDGHSYGFPYIEEMYRSVLCPGPFVINADWLKKVGKEMPQTVDEWVDCLKAFRDYGDLNGNGVADEYPIAMMLNSSSDGFGSFNLFYRFTAAFGCADTYCANNPYADHLRMIDGKVTFTAMDEAFKKTADFFHMLYEEGLIWEGSFDVDSDSTYLNTLVNQEVAMVGTFGCWSPRSTITNADVLEQYEALPRLEGDEGYIGFKLNHSEMQNTSNTAITSECRFPHVVAKFVDYIVGNPDISVMTNWGAEGYNFIRDEQGILRAPLDENNKIICREPYTNSTQMRSNSSPLQGSPIVLNEYYETVCDYQWNAIIIREWQMANGREDILEEYDNIPPRLMTTEELQRLAQIQPTISGIVDRYLSQWILYGDTDSSWEAYKTELKNAGVDELVSIYQGVMDRSSK